MMKSKKNRLLYMGVGIFIITSIVYAILNIYLPHKIPIGNRLNDLENPFITMFLVIVMAPIFEELIFRGIFIEKKFYRFFFYIGGVSVIILTKNYHLFALFFLLIYFMRKGVHQYSVYFLNSAFFALLHYGFQDLLSVYSLIPMFFQFSLGLIFIWVVINYALIYSILLHSLVNAMIIIPLIMVLQFPTNRDKQRLTINQSTLEWNKTELFGTKKFSYSKQAVHGERMTIKEFLKLFKNQELIELKINDSLRFYRYDFNLINTQQEEINTEEVKKIFIEAQLVEGD